MGEVTGITLWSMRMMGVSLIRWRRVTLIATIILLAFVASVLWIYHTPGAPPNAIKILSLGRTNSEVHGIFTFQSYFRWPVQNAIAIEVKGKNGWPDYSRSPLPDFDKLPDVLLP